MLDVECKGVSEVGFVVLAIFIRIYDCDDHNYYHVW